MGFVMVEQEGGALAGIVTWRFVRLGHFDEASDTCNWSKNKKKMK